MSKVVIEMSMSLDGFVAGPDDGTEFPNGRDGIKHVFGWFSRAKEGANKNEVDRMHAQYGAYIFGRRTYDITHGWGGSHPAKVPLFILTHNPPAPETSPRATLKSRSSPMASRMRSGRPRRLPATRTSRSAARHPVSKPSKPVWSTKFGSISRPA